MRTDTPVRIFRPLVERADRLVGPLASRPDFAEHGPLTRAVVLRVALARGLAELEREASTTIDPRLMAIIEALAKKPQRLLVIVEDREAPDAWRQFAAAGVTRHSLDIGTLPNGSEIRVLWEARGGRPLLGTALDAAYLLAPVGPDMMYEIRARLLFTGGKVWRFEGMEVVEC